MNADQQFPIGPVILFGSGETSPSGIKVFDHLFRALPTPPTVSLLETPAGFELNSSQVIQRVGDFIQHRLQNYSPKIYIIPARKRGTEFSPDNSEIAAPILESDLIFMGPGSPSYAIRQLKNSLVWHYVLARHRLGATLVMASAAVVSLSRYALPVYEIYKVGEDPYWNNGLDFFGSFGLPLVLIPHWNNHDGGEELDTSRCFMGQARFSQLISLLPDDISVIGIDEKTALAIDHNAGTCNVLGVGGVTIIHTGHRHRKRIPNRQDSGLSELGEQRAGHIHVYKSGDTFPISICCSLDVSNIGDDIPASVWQKALDAQSQLERKRLIERELAFPTVPYSEDQVPEEIRMLVRSRDIARSQKDWAAADAIRQELAAKGWTVVDTPDGAIVRKD